jgi:quercetin dioxygenase-like cupin family protein
MIIKEVLEQVDSSNNPVAKAIHKGVNFKVLALAFKKGMIMKEHKTSLPAKLTVLVGEVIYRQGSIQRQLGQYDETEIPMDIIHSVECIEDALCLLTQG